MPPGMVDAIAPLIATFMIGIFILLFPLSRRLGRVLEEVDQTAPREFP